MMGQVKGGWLNPALAQTPGNQFYGISTSRFFQDILPVRFRGRWGNKKLFRYVLRVKSLCQ